MFDEYLPNIIKPGNYAGELEIYITSKIFNVSICDYEYQKSEKKYRYLYSYINNEEFISHCMILNHVYLDTGAEHYELLKINSFAFDENELNNINVNENDSISTNNNIKIINSNQKLNDNKINDKVNANNDESKHNNDLNNSNMDSNLTNNDENPKLDNPNTKNNALIID